MADRIAVEKLVLAVVQNDDANAVQAALVEGDYRVTRINTAGGFLRRGNVTFLAGVPAADVDSVIELIRSNVRTRVASGEDDTEVSTMLFVLPIAKYARI